jgi:hypothetical protein
VGWSKSRHVCAQNGVGAGRRMDVGMVRGPCSWGCPSASLVWEAGKEGGQDRLGTGRRTLVAVTRVEHVPALSSSNLTGQVDWMTSPGPSHPSWPLRVGQSHPLSLST